MPGRKRILIVGAGSSGLASIKACLEDRLQPVCLEKTLDIGGLWNYAPGPSAPGTAGIYHSLVINTCKEMTAFSDFPVPTRFPQFLSHANVMTYFRMYAQHFHLLPYIRFNAEVRHIQQAEDYEATGRWTVTYVQHQGKTCPLKCTRFDLSPGEKQRRKSDSDLRKDTNDDDVDDDDEDQQNNVSDLNNKGTWKTQEKIQGLGALNGSKSSERHWTREQSAENDCKAERSLNPNGKEATSDQTADKDQDELHSPSTNNQTSDNTNETTTDKNTSNGEDISTNASSKKYKPNLSETSNSRVSQITDSPQTKANADAAQEPEKETPQEQPDSCDACREVTEDFDGVMICTGHHTVPYVPNFPGQDDFQGQILHSQDYKRPEPFSGRRVLIVGIGNSAVDIASDLAKTARQVYLSTRRGSWVLSRSAWWGIPADMLANSRLMASLPFALLQSLVERQANLRMDHQRLGLAPRHRLLGAHPTINDELPFHLMTRRVEVRADVSRILPQSVQFADGSVQEVDVIIMATGYDYRLDFVDPRVLKVTDNRVHLYQYVFPPHLPHASLAVIGLIQAIGAFMPIAELQSRWFVSLIVGRVHLPARNKMEKDIADREKEMQSRYYQSRRHTLQTFWVQYMDEVAAHIGARPCLWRLMLTRPSLALQCFLGPCLPAQYRLCGPHPWPHAENFIRSVWTRYAHRPRTTRDPNLQPHTTSTAGALDISTQRNNCTPAEGNCPSQSDAADIDDTACAVETDQHNRHRKSPWAMTSARPEVSHPALLLTPTNEDEKCKWLLFYLYVVLVVFGCALWAWIRI